jgi:hypothetical protein
VLLPRTMCASFRGSTGVNTVVHAVKADLVHFGSYRLGFRRCFLRSRAEEQKARSCVLECDDIAQAAEAEDSLDDELCLGGGERFHVSVDDKEPSRQTRR